MTDEHMSKNRREKAININDIKDEIVRERAKIAAKAAEPEADVKPEDLVLFKERAAKKAKAEADALAAEQAEKQRIQAEKAAKNAAKLAKKQGISPSEDETTVEGAEQSLFKPLDEDLDDDGFTKLDTGEIVPIEPIETEIPNFSGDLSTIEQPGMSWNKFWKMSTAKKATIIFGIGLPVLAVIGVALWFTRGWREWTGNLVVFSIPVLIILTYVMDHFAQNKYWEDFYDSKILSRENRQDAAIVIPLILFMATLSLNSGMYFTEGLVHFFRFVVIGACVWAGLIWMTRKVPPIRKIVGDE